jgi:hypothetical protein
MMIAVEDAAKRYGISKSEIRMLINSGEVVTCVECSPQYPPVEKVDTRDLDKYFPEKQER